MSLTNCQNKQCPSAQDCKRFNPYHGRLYSGFTPDSSGKCEHYLSSQSTNPRSHAEMADDFISSLDKVYNVFVSVGGEVCVHGVKNRKIVYREFKPWS